VAVAATAAADTMTDRSGVRQAGSKRPARHLVAVLTAALASFLAVLAMLSARVYNGTGAGLAPTAAVISRNGHTVLRTTASGRLIATTAPAPSTAGAAPAPLSTRSSGSARGLRDE
jgi:hypothetical protein